MVYGRYIKRKVNGKTKLFGPYYYHNKKVDGKVISTYVGTESTLQPKNFNLKKTVQISLFVVSGLLVILLLFILGKIFTGNVSLENDGKEIVLIDKNKDASPIAQENKKTDSSSKLGITGVPQDIINQGEDKTSQTDITKQESNINENSYETVQEKATINSPVKWITTLSLKEKGPAKINLPLESQNVVVYKINENGQREKISENNIKITARVSSEFSSSREESSIIDFFKRIFNFFTGNVVTTKEYENTKELFIDGDSKFYEVEYSTPAPVVVEKKIDRGKEVKVSNPGEIHYQNVLAFTNLDENLNIKNPTNVKIYWVEKNIFLNPDNVIDQNENGIYDFLEWTIPSLSNQTFEIIVITKAEHLDQNKNFISDVYNEVVSLDDLWSGEINNHDYIRITFEKNLTAVNDITIFPRIVSGNPRVEVYEKNSDFLIAEFIDIKSNVYNKIFLTNLQNEQDIFDLRIVGGSIEFDHIVDPVALPGGATELRVQVCSAEDNAASGSFGGVCDGVYPTSCGASNDLVSCNDAISETHTSSANSNFGGIRVEIYNSSITDCQSISQVFICYERWVSATTISLCSLSVDSNGGSSYTATNNTCPGTTANPGVICNNVTALEVWNCGNFFGSSGTRALAKSEFKKSGGSGTRTMNWDVLYFNVTYSNATQQPSILSVESITPKNPTELSTASISFNVNVTDPNGYSDINNLTVNFSKSGETTRFGICNFQSNINATAAIYSCSVDMWYYDSSGIWSINLRVQDSGGLFATNTTNTFTYNELKAIVISQPLGSLSWPSLVQGSSNILSNNDPTVINNTGNYVGPISITARDLIGQINSLESIPSSDFRAGPSSGSECSATQLQNATLVSISGTNLPKGVGATASIYYCLTSVPSVSSQDYSATGSNSWIVQI